MRNPLLDKNFLLKLDEARDRETFVRLIALTFDEHPLETIEGRATQGSLNIDGRSAVRRTCSLTLVANELNINDFYWGMKTKFALEIGIRNKINPEYPDIIWFPFGIFLITSFNTSQNINSYTISISGKDKMCLLNGEIGGSITALSVDFGKYEEIDVYGHKSIKRYDIKQIVRDMVHQFGNEPFHNIIINDLDELGIILKEYRGDSPLYLFKKIDTDEFLQMTLDESLEVTIIDTNQTIPLSSLVQEEEYENIPNTYPFRFDLRNSFTANYNPTKIKLGNTYYTIAKIEYGDTPGYTLTSLTYAGELIASVGDSITSVLDKIVKMLGNFEYFYDVDGRFIFQKKKTYVSTSFDSLMFDNTDGSIYGENAALTSAVSYSFEDSKLVQSFSNSPNLLNLRNDFSIWGTRTSATGAELPVHLRYAIDKKPVYYKNFEGKIYTTQSIIDENIDSKIVDWREIIYQMAIDYRRYNHEDGFEAKLANNNLQYYPTGKTGYEQYYIDIEGFWRQLYNPDYEVEYLNENFIEDINYPRYVKDYLEINTDKATITKETSKKEFSDSIINENGKILDFQKDFYVTKFYHINQKDQFNNYTNKNSFGYFVKINNENIIGGYYDEHKTFISGFNILSSNTESFITLSNIPQNAYFIRFTLPNYIKENDETSFYFQAKIADIRFEDYYIRQEYNSVETATQNECSYIKYIDTIDFETTNYIKDFQETTDYGRICFSKTTSLTGEDIFIPTINTIDLNKYIVYEQQDNAEYIRIIDNASSKYDKKTNVLVKKGEKTFVPVIDLVNVINFKPVNLGNSLYTSNKQFYTINDQGISAEVFLYYKGDITDTSLFKSENEEDRIITNLAQLNSVDWSQVVFMENNKPTEKQIFNQGIYFYYEEDIENKILYTIDNEGKYVELNNNISYLDKKSLYVKIKNKYCKIPDLITQNKKELYYAYQDNDDIKYDLYIKLLIQPDDITLYKINDKNIYTQLDPNINKYYYNYDENNIYYKQYMYSPIYAYNGKRAPSVKLVNTAEHNLFDPFNEYVEENQEFFMYKNKEDKRELVPVILRHESDSIITNIFTLNALNQYEDRKNIFAIENNDETTKVDIENKNIYIYFTAYPEKKEKIQYYSEHYQYDMLEESEKQYWNYDVKNRPEVLNFWFDFLDSDGELEQFSIPIVGDRPKPINDSNVKAIYFRDIPNVLFVDSIPENILKKSGYNYIQLQPGMQQLFVTSSQGKSAKDVLEENIYNHAHCIETISATVIPVYYLEPNTRVFVRDDKSNINGEYILNNMSISLTYNGMMNISANKAIENILY